MRPYEVGCDSADRTNEAMCLLEVKLTPIPIAPSFTKLRIIIASIREGIADERLGLELCQRVIEDKLDRL